MVCPANEGSHRQGRKKDAGKSLGGRELILAYATDRAGPVVRQLIEGHIVVFRRIIFITAHAAYVLFHVSLLGGETVIFSGQRQTAAGIYTGFFSLMPYLPAGLPQNREPRSLPEKIQFETRCLKTIRSVISRENAFFPFSPGRGQGQMSSFQPSTRRADCSIRGPSPWRHRS